MEESQIVYETEEDILIDDSNNDYAEHLSMVEAAKADPMGEDTAVKRVEIKRLTLIKDGKLNGVGFSEEDLGVDDVPEEFEKQH